MDSAVFLAAKTDRGSPRFTEDRAGVYVERSQGVARMVVADGAGTAHRSGLLAELIVRSFRDGVPFGPLDNEAFRRWRRAIGEEWWCEAESVTRSTWYEQENLDRGSAAAFVAVVMDDDTTWCAAIGDCCVFHLRLDPEPLCIASFPIDRWDDFNSSPELVLTDPQAPPVWPIWSRLDVRVGDVLIGASDGLAEWALSGVDQHPEIWSLLVDLSAAGFQRLVAHEREIGTMVDDDTVLARLVIGAGR